MRDKNRVMMWVFGGLGLLILLGGLGFMLYDRQQIAEARDWPSVQGRIDFAQVETERRYRNGRNRTRYVPQVRYSYAVGGTAYTNDDIWLTGSHSYSTHENAAEVLQPYPVGAPVQIFYSPADPRRSALLREGNMGLWVFLLLMGAAFLGVAWWARRRMG
jgi:hypothetical protein